MGHLRQVREASGKSIGAVARAVGVTTTHISKLERNKGGCSPELAEKLVSLLGREHITEEQILYPERFPSKCTAQPAKDRRAA